MAIKMSKKGSFFVFSVDGSIQLVTVCAKHLKAPKRYS